MRTVWKFGSRWDDIGRRGTSIFERVFLPYGVVFTYKDCSAVCEGDLIAIADGYNVIAIARAETPGLRMAGLEQSRYGSVYRKYFSDRNVYGCKAQIKVLDESDVFPYRKMGMFYKAGDSVRNRVNSLGERYFSAGTDENSVPCLFDWANKELAQDSFLCWLLECASSTPRERSFIAERAVGFRFVQEVLRRAKAPVPDECETVVVRVRKQLMNIDVAARISFGGVCVGLLIEDKVGASVYNDIKGYCSRIQADRDFQGLEIFPVIVRTGDESNVVDSKAPYYLREDFLALFDAEMAKVQRSQMLHDFYRHIASVESEIRLFERLRLSEWTTSSWKGFYAALQRGGRVAQNHWNSVCGNGRGFLCAFPAWDARNAYIKGGMVMYWQFESDRRYLALKIMEVGEKKKEVRDLLISSIDAYLRDHPEWSSLGIMPVGRRGTGYSMTIKTIPDTGWYVEKDGVIDFNAVEDRVVLINEFRDRFAKDLFEDERYYGDRLLDLLK